MSLDQYKRKRDFHNSPEPEVVLTNSKESEDLRFVVQRHNASRLHYDLRLEVKGVLKSWAVPKGPSMNPEDKRLAIMVEDHPYEYINFAGVIPKGSYGAGIVEIWDSGTYTSNGRNNENEILGALNEGNLKIQLSGEKLKGGFDLVQIKNNDNSWLLIKRKDEFAVPGPYDSEEYPPKKIEDKLGELVPDDGEEKKSLPHRLQPMLAKVKKEPFDHPDWIFEIKWDGYRTIAEIGNDHLELFSRNGLKFSSKYKSITNELKKIKYNAVLDGEIVVLDEEGHANFQALQHYEEKHQKNLCYYVFDLLHLEGRNLFNVPLIKRKKLLKEILPDSFKILYSDHIVEQGKAFFEMLRKKEIEGMMAKHAKSEYLPGQRSGDWLKIKAENRQDAVIGGFTEPKGSRKHFGSLVLGVYQNGDLHFIGHSGGGISTKSLSEILEKLKPLRQDKSPFKGPVKTNSQVTWIEPELVCEVSYTEWTKEGQMRHPKFLGLRPDKDALEVVREEKDHAIDESPDKNETNNQNRRIEINDIPLSLTNLKKLYWPDEKYTKGDLISYYREIADFILPYLKDRPESLHRHPEGIKGKGFFQKDMRDLSPEWAETIPIYSGSAKKEINYLLCQNEATLIFMTNLGCIELHPWNSRVQSLEQPDYFVIDIDPDENPFDQIIKVALTVKDVLDDAGIRGFCKTSGSTGLHVYVPLGARYDDAQARNFAHLIAQLTHERIPDLTSMERSPRKRKKKIYLDYLQNKTGQTLAATYSVRPKPGATVSTPVAWEELEEGIHPSMFTINTVPKRLEKTGDLFKDVLSKGVDIENALSNLSS
ncbi:MAG: DNA ligase D [Balneolales bacterium]